MLCEASGGYLAALENQNYPEELIWFAQQFCGTDSGALCWTSAQASGYPQAACAGNANCTLPPYVIDLQNGPLQAVQALAVDGRLGILIPTDLTVQLPFICEANLADLSAPSKTSGGFFPEWVFYCIIALMVIGLAYSYTQKPPNTNWLGNHIEETIEEINKTTSVRV